MLIIISPAKRMNSNTIKPYSQSTDIEFLNETKELIKILKTYKPQGLSKLMKISPILGELNYERYLKWEYPFKSGEAGKALLMFQGDVYQGLKAEDFDKTDFTFAQDHLRILSGLYGVIKPNDIILPYRLEMGTKLTSKKGNNLYEFWGEKINKKIREVLDKQGDNILINLASNEYFKSINAKKLDAMIITPEFKEHKDGNYKMITYFAKKARGMMSRYIIKNKLKQIEDLKGFNDENYSFSEALSSEKKYVFIR